MSVGDDPKKVVPINSKTDMPRLDGIVQHLAWPDAAPQPRKWVVDGVIPAATVTLIQGDGGLGKSLLTMQLAYACATGRQWLGQTTKPCRTFSMYCEDEEEELHRRMWDITEHYRDNPDGHDPKLFADLEEIMLVSRVGRDNLLMEFESAEGGRGKVTKLLDQVAHEAKEHGAELIVLDSLHDLFGGNENNRVQVRQFINALQRIAIENGPAVILNGHPSMAGLNSATGTSGSTAWNNSVRSRLYLVKERAHEQEKPPHTGPLMLRIMKANYAAAGTSMELVWRRGFMSPKHPNPTGQSATDKRDQHRRIFMACLEEAYRQNRPPQYAANAKYSAPKMFAQMPTSQGISMRDFKIVMEALINDKTIIVKDVYDHTSRNTTQVLVPAGNGKKTDWDSIPDVE